MRVSYQDRNWRQCFVWSGILRLVELFERYQSGNSSSVPRLAYGLFCAAALLALPSLAHHSYAAYDLTHTLTLKGAVEAFHWSNPHSTFTLVLAPDGHSDPVRWNIVTGGPAVLKRFGWTQNSLKPGDRISVVCNPMTDGSHDCRLHTVVLLDTGQILRTKFSPD